MLDGLKPYPEYKDSGCRWVGRVPAHWEVRRAKYFFREIDERSTTGMEELLTVSHKTGVTPRTQKNVTMFMAESLIGYKLCAPGDVAINTMWAWMAALGVVKQPGIVSPSYGVYRPHRTTHFEIRFLDELLRTPGYRAEYHIRSTGITSSRLRLYPESFLRIPLPCPPPQEQAAIVRFLDHADRLIRRYIRAKQALVKVLEEHKQTIIHRAVTRGLDPNVRLKPSGVDWLGDVPEHWNISRIKFVARLKSGESITAERIEETGPFPVYGGNGLRGYTSAYTHEGEFVLVGRQGALCGNINYASGRFWASEHAVVAYPLQDIAVQWFGELLRSMNLNQYSIAAAQPGLAVERIQNLRIPFPALSEQCAIAEYLKQQTNAIQTAIGATRRTIDLLHEFRTRLVADVVTGKLDVRAAAAALPPAPDDEAEDIDDADLDDEVGFEEAMEVAEL